MRHIMGWEYLLPQLATFFALLPKMSSEELVPFNLFISGKPGTNKTMGMQRLPELLDYKVARVDSATLDDIADVVGAVNLRANREDGVADFIIGELVEADILILDEFPNVRPHVRTQMRLFFQGELVLQARTIPLNTIARIGTGNLSSDLLHGEANVLDSADADRFALVLTAPTLASMSEEDQCAIISNLGSTGFENNFQRAVKQIQEHYDAVAAEFGEQAVRYVRTMLGQTKGTPCEFEGRRAQILYSLVLGGLALCRARTELDHKEVIYAITRDCLSYQRLTGILFEEPKLRAAHNTAIAALETSSIDALIATASTLQQKLDLTIKHLKFVTHITKCDVFGAVLTSDDAVLRIALNQAVENPLFEGESPELVALVKRAPLPFPQGGAQVDPTDLIELACMSFLEAIAYEASSGSKEEAAVLVGRVNEQLQRWGLL